MLLISQKTGLAFQVIPVTGILSNPLNFIPAICFCCEFGTCTLIHKYKEFKLQVDTYLKCNL